MKVKSFFSLSLFLLVFRLSDFLLNFSNFLNFLSMVRQAAQYLARKFNTVREFKKFSEFKELSSTKKVRQSDNADCLTFCSDNCSIIELC